MRKVYAELIDLSGKWMALMMGAILLLVVFFEGVFYDSASFRLELPQKQSVEAPTSVVFQNAAWSFDGTEPFLESVLASKTGSVTSTDSPFADHYAELLAAKSRWADFRPLSRVLYGESSYVIPGIRNTGLTGNESSSYMVPQGVCTAGGYVLISAYCYGGKSKKNSVIYVLDKTSGAYLKTLVLNVKSHVGALASDGTYLYVADSDAVKENGDTYYRLWKYPLSRIARYIARGKEVAAVHLKDYLRSTVKPSFLCTYDGVVFAGDMNGDSDDGRSYMCGYRATTGDLVVPHMKLGRSVQGVDIADLDGKTYVVTSSSYGRNNLSVLTCHRLWKTSLFGWILSPFPQRKISLPNMSEDISIDRDHVLVNFESASRKYQENNTTQLQLDRVLNLSFRALVKGTVLVTPYAGENVSSDAEDETETNGKTEPDIAISEYALPKESIETLMKKSRNHAPSVL